MSIVVAPCQQASRLCAACVYSFRHGAVRPPRRKHCLVAKDYDTEALLKVCVHCRIPRCSRRLHDRRAFACHLGFGKCLSSKLALRPWYPSCQAFHVSDSHRNVSAAICHPECMCSATPVCSCRAKAAAAGGMAAAPWHPPPRAFPAHAEHHACSHWSQTLEHDSSYQGAFGAPFELTTGLLFHLLASLGDGQKPP
jgi:hypothetical protein